MRTSLIETKQIEEYILHQPIEDAAIFEAKQILYPEMNEKILWQKKTYFLIQQYSRKKLREEIEAVHQKLFIELEHESFRTKILRLFSKL